MRTVNIAKLKAHLSQHLRYVRGGETVSVLDRRTEVARIVPPTRRPKGIILRSATGKLPKLRDLPLKPVAGARVDSLTLLREERQVDR